MTMFSLAVRLPLPLTSSNLAHPSADTSSFFGDELWPADKLSFTNNAVANCPSPVTFVYVSTHSSSSSSGSVGQQLR